MSRLSQDFITASKYPTLWKFSSHERLLRH
jgi:hypothetical protein